MSYFSPIMFPDVSSKIEILKDVLKWSCAGWDLASYRVTYDKQSQEIRKC